MKRRRPTSRWNGGGGNPDRSQRFRSQGGNRGNRPQINISAFIEKARQGQEIQAVEVAVERTFARLGLHSLLEKNIARVGFTLLTPIQDKVFDLVNQRKDVVGIANTGTGKTGAFLIPLIDRLLQDQTQKLLILAPTRELAGQIDDTFKELARGARLYSAQCIGGVNISRQMRELSRNPQVVIGTPGRIKDLINRKSLDLSRFSVVVLDEVDRMLDMGFIHDIRQILALTPRHRQSLYFSATIPDRVSQLIRDFSKDVVQISVKTHETVHLVDQGVVKYYKRDKKMEMLHDILISEGVDKVLIFGRTKHGVKKLAFALQDRGFRTDSIHGNKSQSQRQRALADFRENRVSILVATDVAARGLDIDNVSHVINYELPETYDDYVHRIGRTGRMGKRGVAYTFVE